MKYCNTLRAFWNVKEEIPALFTNKTDNCSGSETAVFPVVLYQFE